MSTDSLRNKTKKPTMRNNNRIRNMIVGGRVTKRKAREVTPEEESEDSDSSLSSLPGSEDEESGSQADHRPRPATRRVTASKRAPAPKRRHVMRKMAALKKVPKGLEINMVGW